MNERLIQFVRFLCAGAVNTGATYLLYLLAALIMDPRLAYSAAFVIGIALSYLLNTLFVFRSGVQRRSMVQYPAVYLLQYVFGLGVLHVLVHYFELAHQIAMLAVIAINVPLTFLLVRAVLLGKGARADT